MVNSPSHLTSFNCLPLKAPVSTGATSPPEVALAPMRFDAVDWVAILLAVRLRVEGRDGSPPPAGSGSRLLLVLMSSRWESSVSRCRRYFLFAGLSVVSILGVGEFSEDA